MVNECHYRTSKIKRNKFSTCYKRTQHSLYEQYGFKPLGQIENKMNRPLNWEAVYKGYKIIKSVAHTFFQLSGCNNLGDNFK